MRSLRIATPLVLILSLALAACQQQGAESGEMEEAPADTMAAVSAEEQLEALRDDYVAAWEARDLDALGAMMSPDYREIRPLGVFDRAGAEAMMRDSSVMPPEGATMTIDMQTIEVAESGDVAYASGETTVTIPAAEGREEMTETTSWIAGFKKIDGAWKVDRLALANPDQDGAMAEEDTGSM